MSEPPAPPATAAAPGEPAPAEATPPSAWERFAARPWLGLGVFVALAFAVYAYAIPNEFVFDDNTTLRRNQLVRDPSRILEALAAPLSARGYRPIRYISFMLDYAIGGDRPWIYHIFNSLYHGVTCFLVWRLLLRLAGDARAALAGALLFAVHPAHTECVAYISGRRDLLSTLFYVAAFLSYLRVRDVAMRLMVPGGPSRGAARILGWMVATAFLFLLGLGSKEMAVTFPAMIILHFVVFDGPRLIRSLSRPAIVALAAFISLLLGLGALVAWGAIAAQISGQSGPWGGSWDVHAMTAICLVAGYVRLCVFPATLLADYSVDAFPLARSLGEPRTVASILALLLCAAAAIACLRRAPRVAFGIAWFFLALAPVSQIIPYHELGADHYVYLPSIGLCLLAGLGFARAWERWGRAPALGGLAVVLVAFVVRTEVRIADWRTPETMYRATIATAPRCARASLNLGVTIASRPAKSRQEQRANLTEALALYDTAIECYPDYIYGLVSRARVHRILGREAEERADLERALGPSRATRTPSVPPEEILLMLHRYREAADILEPRALAKRAGAMDMARLARCREMLGDLTGAIDAWAVACKISPRDERPAAAGLTLAQKSGQLARVVWFYGRLRELNPARAEKIMGGSLRTR